MGLFDRVKAGVRVASNSSTKKDGSFDNRTYKGKDRTAPQKDKKSKK